MKMVAQRLIGSLGVGKKEYVHKISMLHVWGHKDVTEMLIPFVL